MSKVTDGGIILWYENCRKRWDRRCRDIGKLSSHPLAKLLAPDEFLDSIDEELVRLQGQLPDPQVSDDQWWRSITLRDPAG